MHSQPQIIPTLHKSMLLRMQNLLMRSSLRRFSARSLLVETRIMTQCLALSVKLPQNLFFRIISYQTKHQNLLNEFHLFLSLSFIIFIFFFDLNLDILTSSIFLLMCKYMERGSLSFPNNTRHVSGQNYGSLFFFLSVGLYPS